MNKISYLFFLVSTFVISGNSQQILGTCGTNGHDNYLIKQRMLENREEWKNKVFPRGGALTYVPITYWLIAKDDGSGRLPYKSVIENLCCLNKTYSEFGIYFYLKAVNNKDNSYIYDDPSSGLGIAYIDQIMLSNYNSVNIFVTNVANASEPGVLAFYRPLENSKGDYVVCSKANLSSNCADLCHEVGHFFSLAHTFYGWESIVYDTITMKCFKATPTLLAQGNGTNVLVEYVDRNKQGTVPSKKNCQEAADGFCDTPADYNLGFGWNGPCNYTGCTKDPDNVKLDPDETNLMSYFLSCIKIFSQEQKDAIVKDMLSNKRNFLRKVNYTVKPDVTDQVNYITPTIGNPPVGYDSIKFDWDDVPNADSYYFELGRTPSFNPLVSSFVIKRSDTTLTNLSKNLKYYWRVTPYNSNSFCLVPSIANFQAPAWTVANENIENKTFSAYVIQPNENELTLIGNSTKSQLITLQILNSNAQVLNSQRIELVTGVNKIPLDQRIPGFYFYRIISENRKENTGKFIKF